MFRKFTALVLSIAHLFIFSPVKDAFAFTAQSQSFNLAIGAPTQGGNSHASTSFKISQDVIGEPSQGKSQSASYILESGYIPTLKSMPPLLTQAIPTQTWNENESKTNAFDLDNYFSSPGGLSLTYTVTGNSNIKIAIDSVTHNVTFSQPQGWIGTEHVRFTAKDAELNSTTSNDVSLQIIQFDHPPVLDYISDITVNENQMVTISPHATDIDGSPVSYAFTQPLNAQGQWQTDYKSAGIYSITVKATDATGLTASQAVRINVKNVNRPPVLDSIAPITASEGDLVAVVPHATDPDGNAIAYYFSSPLDNTGKWLAGLNDAGTYAATVTASDGIDTVSQNIQITINNVNRAPQATLTLSKYTVKPNENIIINLFASDPDGNPMTFSIKKDNVEIASGNITDVYSISTSFSSIGDHAITATVFDSGGLSFIAARGVDVEDPNINNSLINPIMGDFNGDSLTDLGLYNSSTGVWQIALSDAGVYRNAATWLTNFGTSGSWLPMTGDFNGDGKADAAIYNPTTGQFQVALSTGASFSSPSTWFTFSGASSSWQPFVGNFNADKYADLAFYNKSTGEVKVALGTSTGFGSSTTWLTNFGTGSIALAGDFNADSVTDICLFNKTTGEFKVAFSNTKAFVDGSSWISGFATNKDVIISDFNNDGLADIGYWDQATGNWYYAISNGARFLDKGLWQNYGSSSDESATTGDFNGDGIIDLATFDRDLMGINRWKPAISTNRPADLLFQIDNGMGGKTQVAYAYASKSDNAQLPF